MNTRVLIPTRDNDVVLNRTLSSIAECNAPDQACEIVVIENGPKGGAEAIVNKYRFDSSVPMIYYYSKYSGKSAALNDYIFKYLSDEDFVIFTDDDIRFNQSWVINFVATAKEKGDGYFYGGAFGVDFEKRPDDNIMHYLPPSAVGVKDDEFTKNKSLLFLGCNWAVHVGNIKAIGGFDHNLGPGSVTGATGEETAAQIKLLSIGVKPFLAEDNYVWHWVPKEKSNFLWLKDRYYRNGVALKQINSSCFSQKGGERHINLLRFFAILIVKNPFYLKRFVLVIQLLKGRFGRVA